MADDRRAASRHTVNLDRRESMSITGVLDVISFDEETVIVETEMGALILRGANLHVNRLSLDSGELSVDGELYSLNYEEAGGFAKGKSSFFNKLFK